MKVRDFKILGTLPAEYDYEIFHQHNGGIMVLGKNGQTLIGYYIKNEKLVPIDFELFKEGLKDE